MLESVVYQGDEKRWIALGLAWAAANRAFFIAHLDQQAKTLFSQGGNVGGRERDHMTSSSSVRWAMKNASLPAAFDRLAVPLRFSSPC
jgi:hypothetical protein